MPFIETALIGDDSGENINHYGSVRLRVTGDCNLNMKFIGLDDTITQELLPLKVTETSGRELTRLSNFKGQRARLRLETTKINETFNVNRIIFFIKPIYTEYPQ